VPPVVPATPPQAPAAPAVPAAPTPVDFDIGSVIDAPDEPAVAFVTDEPAAAPPEPIPPAVSESPAAPTAMTEDVAPLAGTPLDRPALPDTAEVEASPSAATPADEPAPSGAAYPPSTFRRRAEAPAGAPVEPGSTLPSRLAEDNGPETLASMLPEPVGDWPPRKGSRSRKHAKRPAPPPAPVPPHEAETAPVDIDASLEADEHRFLREHRRSVFWNRPAMRAGLWVTFVVLALGAAAQVAFPLRDTIAARWPSTAPAWDWVCEQAGCTVEAPRALASLALDGTTLTRTETDHVLLFSADLRNKAPWPVRMPAFELKFTDLGGQVVARKVFTPADLGIGNAALTPDTELHVRARLRLEDVDVSGFQAEVFYP
jgi:hypothetical protein